MLPGGLQGHNRKSDRAIYFRFHVDCRARVSLQRAGHWKLSTGRAAISRAGMVIDGAGSCRPMCLRRDRNLCYFHAQGISRQQAVSHCPSRRAGKREPGWI